MCLTWKTSTQGGKNCRGVGEGEESVSMESKKIEKEGEEARLKSQDFTCG